jgi:tRNA 2-selenouridine synthase
MTHPSAALPHPSQLEVLEFSRYGLVVDARSPHEYAEDHVPGAVNLPVVDDGEYAEVGIRHKTDPHGAYLIGVRYALRNIAAQIDPVISRLREGERILVYCFRGGKRSRLWADSLRVIGYEVDVLPGGWKAYRRWVRAALEAWPAQLGWRVLAGSTGSGKTRLLHALAAAGEQVVDLEWLAGHRGSLIGGIPGVSQPTQKGFDSLLLDRLRHFDPARPVWVEAESRKIGNVQLPVALCEAMHRSVPVTITAPMSERVRMWREDYRHWAEDPEAMVRLLAPLKPLVGNEELATWQGLATAGRVDELFERVMSRHYDPCYERSTRRSYGLQPQGLTLELTSLAPHALAEVAARLAREGRDERMDQAQPSGPQGSGFAGPLGAPLEGRA